MKTSELTGATLDWAVAKCEDALDRVELEQVNGVWAVAVPDLGCYFEPSTDWAQGGPIIEREFINIAYDDVWTAEDVYGEQQWGDTPLISAMRCYVASKLGDEVEVPDEFHRP